MYLENSNFLLPKKLPQIHPLSRDYKVFWSEQKRRCIEGFWVSGKWMPGTLYFYCNFGTILLNQTASSKVKTPGRPFLRDLEWEFFYNWSEARGFSGFIDDELYTCARKVHPNIWNKASDFAKQLVREESPNAFKIDGSPKLYIPARDYLRKIHKKNLGRAVYENEAKDFMMMGSRGFGKSYSVGVGIVAHEFLFDGLTEYKTSKQILSEGGVLPSSSIMVGAGDSKYSADILNKTKIALDNLPGEFEYGDKVYPSPLSKRYSGTWMAGKKIVAKYKKKVGGQWKDSGSLSTISHRSFNDNPFAANGLRCGVMVFEEIGMFNNLKASRNASVECVMNGAYKFGSMMFLGTGGDMDKGTIDASSMFRDPETYNLLAFEDLWENKGKIGYFVPAYMGLNQYKNKKTGETNIEAAKEYLNGYREKLKLGKSGSAALDDELQNRPLTPSEVFLTKSSNIFPIYELQQRLLDIQDNTHYLEKHVELYFDKNTRYGVNYRLDLNKKLTALNSFPLEDYQKSNRDGCVTIFEFPVYDESGNVPEDMYLIGHDPYASDNPDGNSLASIYVLKSKKYIKHGHDEIVANFIGRPHMGRKVVNEIMYKLSLFYGNAKIYFENVRGNVQEYFEKIKRLDLLAAQPRTILTTKASWDQPLRSIVYGYPMSNKKVKVEAINYLRDWLIEERGTNSSGILIRNLDLIPDKGLLQELIQFDYDGNFDRVMGFAGCILGLEETHNQYIEMVKEKNPVSIDFLTNNKSLFL